MGWRLRAREWWALKGGKGALPSGVLGEVGKWTHLALVCDRGQAQLWVDGRLAKSFGDCGFTPSSGQFTVGGGPKDVLDVPNGFDGQIDEVRLSEFQGPFDPKMLLFQPSQEGRK